MLADALGEALSGRRCVSAWLGYGKVLFLGLGDAPSALCGPDGLRARPPYELETNFADWSVQLPGSSADADSTKEQAERAVGELIGRPVAGWQLGADNTVR